MECIFSLKDLDSVAAQVVAQNPNKILLFQGEMGAGKTTFIKQLCKTLGVTEPTSSPTFSLVNEYQTTTNQTIYHFDFYRINSQNEALDIGAEEYFYSGNWCFIEWADKVADLIPEGATTITITVLPEGNRLLQMSPSGI
ncbi:tRNA (adenosine(37)-N6)-threonylcarbamoyltransferase complex ATPase subunit type 1 TsaE [Flavobacterium crassostreae]|uniref:tRNA threonylcarbamoyladenosine biosynthesis protein TsaE n=1 Tax=Flavobacterium crassostreae TaxID=1763534 RepID=A0A1B9E9F1_9FLAO|nr:tRNA (adenosine(37)-N6)-threonylcarbamoyltransferase complex ATPase subunit type 1 TsaE [Flavobacterium crassostreae]OCB78566.1 tRNA threonylcarbamoyladenosine biosynthesis protein TsaE [Flavobacterium crassostreae]